MKHSPKEVDLHIRRLIDDESGQILRKVIVSGLVFAFIIFLIVEFGPLIWQRFDVMQTSEDVAIAAAQNYRLNKSEKQVLDEVTNKLQLGGFTDEEIRMSKVLFLPGGSTEVTAIKVEISKYANTLITKHVNALKKYSKITSTKEVPIVEGK